MPMKKDGSIPCVIAHIICVVISLAIVYWLETEIMARFVDLAMNFVSVAVGLIVAILIFCVEAFFQQKSNRKNKIYNLEFRKEESDQVNKYCVALDEKVDVTTVQKDWQSKKESYSKDIIKILLVSVVYSVLVVACVFLYSCFPSFFGIDLKECCGIPNTWDSFVSFLHYVLVWIICFLIVFLTLEILVYICLIIFKVFNLVKKQSDIEG